MMMTLGTFGALSRVHLSATSTIGRLVISVSTCSYAMYLAHIMILNAFHDLYDGAAPVAALVPMILPMLYGMYQSFTG